MLVNTVTGKTLVEIRNEQAIRITANCQIQILSDETTNLWKKEKYNQSLAAELLLKEWIEIRDKY